MNASTAITIARKHVGNGASMDSSARLCLSDALVLEAAGEYGSARSRALRSLGYSVGIFHADYQRVAAAVK